MHGKKSIAGKARESDRRQERLEAFQRLVASNGFVNLQQVLSVARKHNIPEEHAKRIAFQLGFLVRKNRRPTIEHIPERNIARANLKIFAATFKKFEKLFWQFANPYIAKGVPETMRYNYCMDYSMATIGKFRGARSKLNSWVTNGWAQAMRSAYRDFLTREKKEHTVGSKKKGYSFWDTQGSEQMRPEEETILFEQRQRLHKALAQLPAREREIIQRYYGIGTGISETHQEIGDSLGISRTASTQNVERALKKLREALQEE
ncbi:MAG: sigma-70 family RNA polymerase sigma factor [Candidatus ainarchaeum sp.]|nr:sigma-70 family RNA polymerase sigma factor [Candidatus ainarchaeum sp.]